MSTRADRETRFADLGMISIKGRTSPAGVLLPPPGHEVSEAQLTTMSCVNRSCGPGRRYRTSGPGMPYACSCVCHTRGLDGQA